MAYLLGIPFHETVFAGGFIGEKIILSEFVAYASPFPYPHRTGVMQMDQLTVAVLSFALCGFANLNSVAVMSGAFATVVPGRRSEIARYGLRVVLAATLSNLLSKTIEGMFLLLTWSVARWPSLPHSGRCVDKRQRVVRMLTFQGTVISGVRVGGGDRADFFDGAKGECDGRDGQFFARAG